MQQITKDVKVGIWENSAYIANVYADKIILTIPYVKWIGNSGNYAERKLALRDIAIIAKVLADLADGAEDSAWEKIGRAAQDDRLDPPA